MSVQSELARIAQEIAKRAKQDQSNLEKEIIDLKAETMKKEAALDAARLAPKRLADFRVSDGVNWLCPICWMNEGIEVTLRPIGRPIESRAAHDVDFFRCNACNRTYEG